MPFKILEDRKNKRFSIQWGPSGTPYYFTNAKDFNQAYAKSLKQMQAIVISQLRKS